MLRFFIEVYVNIIDCYNHLVPENEEDAEVEESSSSHYIITINDPSQEPPIATYDQLFMETKLHEQYQLEQSTRQTTMPSQHSQQSQLSNNSHQSLEDIHLQQSVMLTNMIIDDYYVIEDKQTQNIIDNDDEWEFIRRP
jgi:hypothetical protein